MALSEQDRLRIAQRIVAEFEDDWVVNIGTGMPTAVLKCVPTDRDIIFHSENGIVGMGPEPADPKDIDNDLQSAGKRPVTLLPGGCFVHHRDSFAIARGGKLDAAVLGGYQVAENGDFANWKLPGATLGSIGGAMDISVGAKRVFAMMTHVTPDGRPKIVKKLSYPLTAYRCVTKIFTELAVISVTPRGLVLEELAPGVSVSRVRELTEPELILAPALQAAA